MNGSGCKNCPVKPCETINYRGSTCSAQRAKYGLGDPMTNGDRIRAMSDEELAVWMTSIRLDILNELCKKFDVEIEMPVPTVKNTAEVREWLQQPTEGE